MGRFGVVLLGCIVFVFTPVATAQFESLATTDDGSVLYFATNLRQKNTAQTFYGKIFKVDSAGIQMYAAREKVEPPPLTQPVPGGFRGLSNYYWLSTPDVSGDGKVVAYSGTADCYGAAYKCATPSLTEATVTGTLSAPDLRLPGYSRLSQNGAYALSVGNSALAHGLFLTDVRSSGTPAPIASFCTDATVSPVGRVVSNNGEVALFCTWVLRLIKPGIPAPSLGELLYNGFGAESPISGPVMDANGSVVVFASRWQLPPPQFSRIRVFRRSDSSIRTVVEGYGDFYSPVVTTDGSRLLFLSTATDGGEPGPAQAFIANMDGTRIERLTNDPRGIRTASISGDGRVAWVVTGAGRLLRIDTGSKTWTEIIGRTPFVDSVRPFTATSALSTYAATGSLAQASGTVFVDSPISAASIPLPRELNGLSASLGGVDVPLLQVSPGDFTFQVPWELDPGAYDFKIQTSIETQWENSVQIPIWTVLPVDVSSGVPAPITTAQLDYTLAAHGDWSGTVTPSNPARRGEVVHVYATGLGPVKAPVQTGVPAPATPLPETVQGAVCTYGSDIPLKVFYTGLAPGTVGIYQVSVELPSTGTLSTPFTFQCGFGIGTATAFTALLPYAAR